jgi:kynurenine formamidase
MDINFSEISKCPSYFSDKYQPILNNSSIIHQVAHGTHVEIPVHFTSTTINTASVQKFKFPLKTPPPNKTQDCPADFPGHA